MEEIENVDKVNEELESQETGQADGDGRPGPQADSQGDPHGGDAGNDGDAEKKKRARRQPEFVRYVTKGVVSGSFDIQIRGQVLVGVYGPGRQNIVFNVPAELVKPFEQHHHFVMGNVVREKE
jgi:hypothetical protein